MSFWARRWAEFVGAFAPLRRYKPAEPTEAEAEPETFVWTDRESNLETELERVRKQLTYQIARNGTLHADLGETRIRFVDAQSEIARLREQVAQYEKYRTMGGPPKGETAEWNNVKAPKVELAHPEFTTHADEGPKYPS